MSDIGVCLDPFFTALSYPERIKKIAALGFKKYEFWSGDYSLTDQGMIRERKNFDRLAELNTEYGLEVTDILYSPEKEGVKASLIKREDKNRLVDEFAILAEAAKKIRCGAFIITGGDVIPSQSRDASLLNLFDALSALEKEAAKHRITLLLEPLNTKVNHPNTFLSDPRLTAELVRAVGSPWVKILYDVYHMQIMGGDILSFVRENLNIIGHFHIAGVPGRNEPYSGELDYERIVREIRSMGYTGAFGLEYWAKEEFEISLKKTLEYFSRGNT